MQKIVWLSDLHFSNSTKVLGYDAHRRVDAAIDFVNQHLSECSACIISGDMVNRGTNVDYNALAKKLDRMEVPYFPMVGNHDDRALFKTSFQLPTNCMSDFVQYRIETDEATLLCLDTLKVGSDAGEFCRERTEWLAKELASSCEKPAFLFMHHPPMDLGLPILDQDKMGNGDAFLDLISNHNNVKHLFIGHVHRPITGTIRGIPFATMRSTMFQAPPPMPAWDWTSFKPAIEAPNLGLLTISSKGLKSDVILQYLQFCEHGLGHTI